jgi:hypothetical protein
MRLAFVLAAALIFSPVTILRAEPPAGILTLDTGIVHVRMVGRWGDPTEGGPVRLVLARDGADATLVRLYVQWLKDAVPAATIEVVDIAAGRLTVLDIRPDQGEGEIAVHLHARTESGEEPSPLLLIREPGTVDFSPAGN